MFLVLHMMKLLDNVKLVTERLKYNLPKNLHVAPHLLHVQVIGMLMLLHYHQLMLLLDKKD